MLNTHNIRPYISLQILIFCWPCISIYLFININQLDALNFLISLFQTSTCFEHMCSSSGGQNCIIQSLVSSHVQGAVSCTDCVQIAHGTATYRCDDTRDCVKQFCPPDDEHMCSKHVEVGTLHDPGTNLSLPNACGAVVVFSYPECITHPVVRHNTPIMPFATSVLPVAAKQQGWVGSFVFVFCKW